MFRGDQTEYICDQYFYDAWFLPFELYGTEHWRRKTGEDSDGISDRAETFGADSTSVCSPLFRTQPADDGTFPECRKLSGDPCGYDVSSDRLAVVFHDRGETYDRWDHPWFRGNDLLCHRDDSGPDSSNRICTDAFAQIWKYGNLDGVAVRVDRSNCIDDYFLSESKKWIWNEKCRWSEMTGGVFLFVY